MAPSRTQAAGQQITDAAKALMTKVREDPGTSALVALATLAIAVVYRPVLAWLWDTWMTNPYYSHGLLVVPIAAYVMVHRRGRFASRPKLVHDADYAVLALAGILFVAGRYFSSNYMQAWSLYPLLLGTLLVTHGRPRVQVWMWPLAFLLLVIPVPLLEGFFAPLQLIAANGAGYLAAASPWIGQVTWDSVSITVDGMTFAIVPLCAGLSSTLSLFAVTAVASLVWPLALIGRLVLYGAVVPVALVANMARIFSTVQISVLFGADAGTSFFHGPGGVLLYLVALAAIGVTVWGLRKWESKQASPATNDNQGGEDLGA